VRRALPPVGVQSTAEQLLQTTTVWLWLKTVVLHRQGKMSGNTSKHVYSMPPLRGFEMQHMACRLRAGDYVMGVQAK